MIFPMRPGYVTIVINKFLHNSSLTITLCCDSFHDLAWSDHYDNKRGIVAGALDNGSLKLWDADRLLNGTRFAMASKEAMTRANGWKRCIGSVTTEAQRCHQSITVQPKTLEPPCYWWHEGRGMSLSHRQTRARYLANCVLALRHGLEQRREPIPSRKRRSCRRHRMLGLE